MNDPTPFEVWRDVRALVINGLDRYRRHAVDVIGLPFSRIRALRRLLNGPLTHAALAEAMMVDRPAVTVAVDDLCARGLVVRQTHPTDRRCKLVALTEPGRLLAERIETLVPPPPQGWDELPPEELAVLAAVANRLAKKHAAR
ncbi:MAG TPA: MarR family transcriptional regulator [Pseudonocardia sp.]